MEIKGEHTSLKACYVEIKKTLMDLQGIYEGLAQCASNLNSVVSYPKVEEGPLMMINDEFGANVARLDKALKKTQAEVSHDLNIREKIGVIEAVKELKSNAPGPIQLIKCDAFYLFVLKNNFLFLYLRKSYYVLKQ